VKNRICEDELADSAPSEEEPGEARRVGTDTRVRDADHECFAEKEAQHVTSLGADARRSPISRAGSHRGGHALPMTKSAARTEARHAGEHGLERLKIAFDLSPVGRAAPLEATSRTGFSCAPHLDAYARPERHVDLVDQLPCEHELGSDHVHEDRFPPKARRRRRPEGCPAP